MFDSNRSAVRQLSGKFATRMYSYVEQVKMLEVFKGAKMIKYQNGDDFAIGDFVRAVTTFFAVGIRQFLLRFDFFGIFFAKIINHTKNMVILSLVSKLMDNRILLFIRYKDTKYLLTYQLFIWIS